MGFMDEFVKKRYLVAGFCDFDQATKYLWFTPFRWIPQAKTSTDDLL
jgi:hypothetical protein